MADGTCSVQQGRDTVLPAIRCDTSANTGSPDVTRFVSNVKWLVCGPLWPMGSYVTFTLT
jgi:hypothetical protein